VKGFGGYRFCDFAKFGFPLMILVVLVLPPLFGPPTPGD